MRRSNDSDCNWQRLQLFFKMAAWLALAFCWSTRNFSLSKLRSWGFTSLSARYVFSGIVSYQCVFFRLAVLRECAGFCELKMDPRFAGCRRWQTERARAHSHNQLSVHARASVFSSSPTDALRFPVLFVYIVLIGVWRVALARCRWFLLEFRAYVSNETKPLSRARKRVQSNVRASPWSKWHFAYCMIVQFSNFIDM